MATFTSGARSSEQKPRYDLIPREALEREAVRMAQGAEAHGINNYRKGLEDHVFIADRINHLIEHALRYADGDRSDDHLAAIRANAGMLIWMDTHRPVVLVNGRFYCPTCHVVAQVMRHPDAEVRCPKCDTVAQSASGDEA